MLANIVVGLTVTTIATAARWFWKRYFKNPDPAEAPSPVDLDGTRPAQEKEAAAAAPLGVRWSWRRHSQSGLRFLRVTVTNARPEPVTVTHVRLKISGELAHHANPPADLMGASDYAVALFGQNPGDSRLPRALDPGGSTEAYFPCRDVADWLYDVAESENIDRNECYLTPECVDGAGGSHPAKRKVNYENWLRNGHGPSLRQYVDREDPKSAGGYD